MSYVEVGARQLSVPAELCRYLASHRFYLDAGERCWIRARSPKNRLRRALEPLRRSRMLCPELLEACEERAVYRRPPKLALGEGRYRIVNYGDSLLLVPQEAADDSAGRQTFWSKIEDYHEHRDHAKQDHNAAHVSSWLAERILRERPVRILELGCGSGRNLHYLDRNHSGLELYGLDINRNAVAAGRRNLGDARNPAHLVVNSIYELNGLQDASFDVVFTSGVLMHVPHERVGGIVREMTRIARGAVVHFELHGPANDFDFHRYPRDYAALYRELGLAEGAEYEVFPRSDFRSRGTESFRHALLVARGPAREALPRT
jgi:SAM-dependent methyltransferase